MISKKYVVYILKSSLDGTFYIGYTQNIERRLREHNSGKSRYTKRHKPYEVVYREEYVSVKQEKDREKYIKKYRNIRAFLKSRVPPSKARD